MLSYVLLGLGTGSVYALVALGYNVVYRASGVFSFAQGTLVMLGSMFAYSLTVDRMQLNPWVALLVVAVLVALIGVAVERVCVRTLAGPTDTYLWVLTTLGISIILVQAASQYWGSVPLRVPSYLSNATVRVDDVLVPTALILAFGVLLVTLTLLWALERFTLTGTVLRALAGNRQAVEAAGINIYRYQMLAFAIGGAVCGVAGFALAPVTFASVQSGQTIGLVAFACWAVGGIGSNVGCAVGAWIVGIAQNFVIGEYGAQYALISVFVLLLAFLMMRPSGLFGRQAVRQA
jgi:branched-chain amino acid transport system permease protein